MAAGVPPPPLNSPSGSYYWLEWYTNLTNFLNGTNIPWSNLNFTGSNLTDIITRNHNDLKNIQGGNATSQGVGNAYHMAGVGNVAGNVATGFPTGWTLVHTGTGTYTINHNLTINALHLQVMATSNTLGVHVDSVTFVSAGTSFAVHLVNNSGTATDADFSFMCSIA